MDLKTVPEVIAHLKGGVFVRLQRAQHGIGVFAIRDIPAGMDPFQEVTLGIEFLSVPMAFIDENSGIPPGVRKYVQDLCADKAGNYNFPRCGFNALGPLFFMNHSTDPNVGVGGEVFFQALRNIREGEELTADYGTYSDTIL